MSGSSSIKKSPGRPTYQANDARDEYMPAQARGSYVLQHNARFHPASSRYVKPLIKSSSEAPFTCYGSPTLHRLSARYHPHQVTPLHHRWRMYLLWHLSIMPPLVYPRSILYASVVHCKSKSLASSNTPPRVRPTTYTAIMTAQQPDQSIFPSIRGCSKSQAE